MSFYLAAPYPGCETTTVLPSPQFGNEVSLTDEVTSKRAIDGTLYTYVRRKTRKRFQWTFMLSRNKSLELRAFLTSYFASRIKVTDHANEVWVGYFTINPFEFKTERRAGPPIQNWPRGEQVSITLEFEGEPV